MTIKEAKEVLTKINKECAEAAMRKDWTRARELNELAIAVQGSINKAIYGQGR